MADDRDRSNVTDTERREDDSDAATPQRSELNDTARERVARRAYERFRARGEEHGRDQEDWFEAEREERERSGE